MGISVDFHKFFSISSEINWLRSKYPVWKIRNFTNFMFVILRTIKDAIKNVLTSNHNWYSERAYIWKKAKYNQPYEKKTKKGKYIDYT